MKVAKMPFHYEIEKRNHWVTSAIGAILFGGGLRYWQDPRYTKICRSQPRECLKMIYKKGADIVVGVLGACFRIVALRRRTSVISPRGALVYGGRRP